MSSAATRGVSSSLYRNDAYQLFIKLFKIIWLNNLAYKLLMKKGVWQELLFNKYLHSKTLSQVSAKTLTFLEGS
jgi:hypothetical protein